MIFTAAATNAATANAATANASTNNITTANHSVNSNLWSELPDRRTFDGRCLIGTAKFCVDWKKVHSSHEFFNFMSKHKTSFLLICDENDEARLIHNIILRPERSEILAHVGNIISDGPKEISITDALN